MYMWSRDHIFSIVIIPKRSYLKIVKADRHTGLKISDKRIKSQIAGLNILVRRSRLSGVIFLMTPIKDI